MTENEYKEVCNAVNKTIQEFNAFLSIDHLISPIDVDSFFQLENKCWKGANEINLGEVAFQGVYIIVGKNINNNTPNLYIGKVSFNSAIGARLSQHLRAHYYDDEHLFMWKHLNCKLYRVYTINLSNMVFMSSALEEFMIDKMKPQFTLVNGTGNN